MKLNMQPIINEAKHAANGTLARNGKEALNQQPTL